MRGWISSSNGASSLQRRARLEVLGNEPMAPSLSCGPVPGPYPFLDSIYPVRETVESALSTTRHAGTAVLQERQRGTGPRRARTKFCSIGIRELRYLPETGNLERRSRCLKGYRIPISSFYAYRAAEGGGLWSCRAGRHRWQEGGSRPGVRVVGRERIKVPAGTFDAVSHRAPDRRRRRDLQEEPQGQHSDLADRRRVADSR